MIKLFRLDVKLRGSISSFQSRSKSKPRFISKTGAVSNSHSKIICPTSQNNNNNNNFLKPLNSTSQLELYNVHKKNYHCQQRTIKRRMSTSASPSTFTSTSAKTTAFQEQNEVARQIFKAAVNSVLPVDIIRSKLVLSGNGELLSIDNKEIIKLNQFQNIYVVGFGKAVLEMAEETVQILGPRVTDCIISVPEGTRRENNPKIRTFRGAKNNIPDENALAAAFKILELVKTCTPEDLLLVLISGGGSALLPMPKPPITLHEKSSIIRQLSKAGASIDELNTLRTKLSLVKGGGLVEMCSAKRVISLILSDVLGDPLSLIASGPTVTCQDRNNININDDNKDARNILLKYVPNLHDVPQSILTVLNESEKQKQQTNFQSLSNCSNFIIGNNQVALDAAARATKTGAFTQYTPCILTRFLQGEAKVVGGKLTCLADFIGRVLNSNENDERLKISNFQEFLTSLWRCTKLKLDEDFSIDLNAANHLYDTIMRVKNQGRGNGNLCLLLGGETTVTVKGAGVGGRNQELALSAAIKLNQIQKSSSSSFVTILSAGTDGIDGPCSAAGAVVNSNTVEEAQSQKWDPSLFLNDNDSYHFFQAVSNGLYHVVTGLTGTNVMDIIIILIQSQSGISQNKSTQKTKSKVSMSSRL